MRLRKRLNHEEHEEHEERQVHLKAFFVFFVFFVVQSFVSEPGTPSKNLAGPELSTWYSAFPRMTQARRTQSRARK
jgi:hypothetical protein